MYGRDGFDQVGRTRREASVHVTPIHPPLQSFVVCMCVCVCISLLALLPGSSELTFVACGRDWQRKIDDG